MSKKNNKRIIKSALILTRSPNKLDNGLSNKNDSLAKTLNNFSNLDIYIIDNSTLPFEKYSCNYFHYRMGFRDFFFSIKELILFRLPLQNLFYIHKNLQKDLLARNYDLIVFSLPRAISINTIKKLKKKNTRVILDLADKMSASYKSISKFEKNILKKIAYLLESSRLDFFEKKYLYLFDQVFMFNSNEVNSLSSYGNILQVRHGANFRSKTNFQIKSLKKNINFMFLGKLNYPPNEQGLKFLIKEVWPLIDKKNVLNIIGSDLNNSIIREISGIENVIYHGFIDNLENFSQKVVCNLAPIFSGGGIQNKLIDSLSLKIPTITTKKALSAFDSETRKIFYLAETKKDWIEIINNFEKYYYKFSVKNLDEILKKFDWNLYQQDVRENIEHLFKEY